jgi:hypothetical protein
MKAFLSSTKLDLESYRNQAADALRRLDLQVGQMEIFGARPDTPQAASLEEVKDSDIFVGIYAHRYGFVPAGSQVSITEAEFQHAKNLNKPRFCFVVDETHEWPLDQVEDDPGRSKLKVLIGELKASLVLDRFTTPDNLAFKIATSVARYLRQPLVPEVTGLRDMLKENSKASAEAQQACFDALKDVLAIANRTLRYIARRRTLPARDIEEESQLSQGWETAGLKLLALENPPGDLVNRYFLKAQYWSDPTLWTEESIDAAHIRLGELEEESRRLLLKLHLVTTRTSADST